MALLVSYGAPWLRTSLSGKQTVGTEWSMDEVQAQIQVQSGFHKVHTKQTLQYGDILQSILIHALYPLDNMHLVQGFRLKLLNKHILIFINGGWMDAHKVDQDPSGFPDSASLKVKNQLQDPCRRYKVIIGLSFKLWMMLLLFRVSGMAMERPIKINDGVLWYPVIIKKSKEIMVFVDYKKKANLELELKSIRSHQIRQNLKSYKISSNDGIAYLSNLKLINVLDKEETFNYLFIVNGKILNEPKYINLSKEHRLYIIPRVIKYYENGHQYRYGTDKERYRNYIKLNIKLWVYCRSLNTCTGLRQTVKTKDINDNIREHWNWNIYLTQSAQCFGDSYYQLTPTELNDVRCYITDIIEKHSITTAITPQTPDITPHDMVLIGYPKLTQISKADILNNVFINKDTLKRHCNNILSEEGDIIIYQYLTTLKDDWIDVDNGKLFSITLSCVLCDPVIIKESNGIMSQQIMQNINSTKTSSNGIMNEWICETKFYVNIKSETDHIKMSDNTVKWEKGSYLKYPDNNTVFLNQHKWSFEYMIHSVINAKKLSRFDKDKHSFELRIGSIIYKERVSTDNTSPIPNNNTLNDDENTLYIDCSFKALSVLNETLDSSLNQLQRKASDIMHRVLYYSLQELGQCLSDLTGFIDGDYGHALTLKLFKVELVQLSSYIKDPKLLKLRHDSYWGYYNDNDIINENNDAEDDAPMPTIGLMQRAILDIISLCSSNKENNEKEVLDELIIDDLNGMGWNTSNNGTSSRSISYCIIIMIVESQKMDSAKVHRLKLNEVHLAASERVYKSGLNGKILKESKQILKQESKMVKALNNAKENVIEIQQMVQYMIQSNHHKNDEKPCLLNKGT